MDEELINLVLDTLRELINIEEIEINKIRMVIRVQIRKCLNYMHRNDFPIELVEPLAETIAMEYMGENTEEIKSIQVGDIRIDYNSCSLSKDLTITTMKEQLRKFRKIGVIKHGIIKEK